MGGRQTPVHVAHHVPVPGQRFNQSIEMCEMPGCLRGSVGAGGGGAVGAGRGGATIGVAAIGGVAIGGASIRGASIGGATI